MESETALLDFQTQRVIREYGILNLVLHQDPRNSRIRSVPGQKSGTRIKIFVGCDSCPDASTYIDRQPVCARMMEHT